MARVRANDETWTDFRAAAGQQPLNELLGELVQRHVDRYRSQRLKDGQLDDDELLDALERARELHTGLRLPGAPRWRAPRRIRSWSSGRDGGGAGWC